MIVILTVITLLTGALITGSEVWVVMSLAFLFVVLLIDTLSQ